MIDELHEDDRKDNYQPMTDRTNDQMTDETRDEIVRLAREGLDANEIALNLNVDHQDMPDLEPEQVQAVVDEADREVERMLTPSVPADNDAIGRIAKWLDDARESGYGSMDIAEMLVESTVRPMTERTGSSVADLIGRELDRKAIKGTTASQAKIMADRLDSMAEDQG